MASRSGAGQGRCLVGSSPAMAQQGGSMQPRRKTSAHSQSCCAQDCCQPRCIRRMDQVQRLFRPPLHHPEQQSEFLLHWTFHLRHVLLHVEPA